jgi:hypothetical protein
MPFEPLQDELKSLYHLVITAGQILATAVLIAPIFGVWLGVVQRDTGMGDNNQT